MWPEVIKFLGGATLLFGTTAWLIRSIVIHLLNRNIEQFKQQLQFDAEKELAKLRSALEIENSKLQIKLSVLETRRITLLEELYRLIVDLSNEAYSFNNNIFYGDIVA